MNRKLIYCDKLTTKVIQRYLEKMELLNDLGPWEIPKTALLITPATSAKTPDVFSFLVSRVSEHISKRRGSCTLLNHMCNLQIDVKDPDQHALSEWTFPCKTQCKEGKS